jgi:alpha-aminoadipic semialdehyde synthase
MSVDILPSELPLDSSRHFSDKLLPYLRSLIRSEQGKSLSPEDAVHLETIQRGTIAQGGKLQEPHSWLANRLGSLMSPFVSAPVLSITEQPTPITTTGVSKKRRVLLLGSGMVARPAVDHIATRKDVELVVGEYPFPCLGSEILTFCPSEQ